MAERLPAFHRHVLVTPHAGSVSAWVEDDFHHIGVTLDHAGGVIRAVVGEIRRAPWTTCPGAVAQLAATFTGVRIDATATRGEKRENCTHLYDMAVLAAAHAGDAAPTRYEIVVTDPRDGVRTATLSRDAVPLLLLIERDGMLIEPVAAAGKSLFQLNDWIAGLTPSMQEAARLLRWAAIIAHGRTIPLDRQSDATRMPATCFTFQPGRKEHAVRIGESVDFTTAGRAPLAA